MNSFLAILALINGLIPLIMKTIDIVEAAFPQSGQGAAKLKAVTTVVEGAAQVAGMLPEQVAHVSAIIAPIVSSIVSLANATGVFKTSNLKGAQ